MNELIDAIDNIQHHCRDQQDPAIVALKDAVILILDRMICLEQEAIKASSYREEQIELER